MGLWLFDKAGNAIHEIYEYNSVITTERYREHSEFSGAFSPADYAKFDAAYFAQMGGETEVYLVEKLKLTTGKNLTLEVSGRSASALLSTRTIVGTKVWNAITAGWMINTMMDDFTGSRAIALYFGVGTDVGAAFSLQRSWGDCGEIALEILAAQNLGMRTRWGGSENTMVMLDIFAAADVGTILGEKFGDGSTGRLITDETSWRNYAYVLGEGEGAARVQVIVNQAGTSERRELYVDASDLQQGTLTLAEYQAVLSARGAAALADTRRLEYAEAENVAAALKPGDVTWFDAGAFGTSFMASEVVSTYEGGNVTRSVAMGDPPAIGVRALRRYVK